VASYVVMALILQISSGILSSAPNGESGADGSGIREVMK